MASSKLVMGFILTHLVKCDSLKNGLYKNGFILKEKKFLISFSYFEWSVRECTNLKIKRDLLKIRQSTLFQKFSR